MRVYNRADFLKLPAGTMYAKGGKWFFDEIEFKLETIVGNGRDDWRSVAPTWIEDDEATDTLPKMRDEGTSHPMQTSSMRDGCYDDTDLFLVFEREDLLKFKGLVETAIEVAE